MNKETEFEGKKYIEVDDITFHHHEGYRLETNDGRGNGKYFIERGLN